MNEEWTFIKYMKKGFKNKIRYILPYSTRWSVMGVDVQNFGFENISCGLFIKYTKMFPTLYISQISLLASNISPNKPT